MRVVRRSTGKCLLTRAHNVLRRVEVGISATKLDDVGQIGRNVHHPGDDVLVFELDTLRQSAWDGRHAFSP